VQTKQRLVVLGGIVAVAVAVVLIVMPRMPQGQVDARRLFEAIHAYAQQARANGEIVPATVSLQEMLARGVLQPEDVSAFDGMEVTVSLKVNDPNPGAVLLEARAPDGYRIVLLADGSVQTYAK
jgi:Na+-translocating ferredoxin:NAD+ oxidoreductase RnfG subunit